MKKSVFKALALSAAFVAAGTALAGCDNQEKPTTSKITTTETTTEVPTTTETTTEVPTTTETTTEVPTTTSETTTETTTEVPTTTLDPDLKYDAITQTCKLKKSFGASSEFLVDGIEEVTLVKATDGDTANFRCKYSGTAVTARFYAIDTPESTGSVEPWGKAASKFTKEKLQNAAAILLEGSETPPTVDSYGSRYLCYVWYKETETSDWKNLNLELVENGYTISKALPSDAYESYFTAAEDFAKKGLLHIHGPGDGGVEAAIDVTVEELYKNFSNYYDKEEEVGTAVRFEGYVSDLSLGGSSGSQTYTFKVSDFDDENTVYTINVYAGYNSQAVTGYLKVGSKYSFTGTVQLHSGTYQVSGLKYVPLETGGDYVSRLAKTYYMTFNSNVTYENYREKTALYRDATVTAASVSGTTLTITATAVNTYYYDDDPATEAEEFTFLCTVDSSFNAEALVGRTFAATGIQAVNGSGVIQVLRYSDFKFR